MYCTGFGWKIGRWTESNILFTIIAVTQKVINNHTPDPYNMCTLRVNAPPSVILIIRKWHGQCLWYLLEKTLDTDKTMSWWTNSNMALEGMPRFYPSHINTSSQQIPSDGIFLWEYKKCSCQTSPEKTRHWTWFPKFHTSEQLAIHLKTYWKRPHLSSGMIILTRCGLSPQANHLIDHSTAQKQKQHWYFTEHGWPESHSPCHAWS